VIYRLLHETPGPLPPTSFQGISRDVQGILHHALAKDPANRFQTAEDLATVLRAAKDTAWRWEQERPTTTLKIKRVSTDRPPVAPTPPRGISGIPSALRAPLPPKAPMTGSGSFNRPIVTSRPPVREPQLPPITGQHGRTEVRNDVLETTKHQLLQALEIDPTNAKTHAMLLVTDYRLGRLDAVMQTLRQARNRGIMGSELRSVPRCKQLVTEEMNACRLPLDLHSEFMEYLGH
jgi:serine/threonine protein kinase